MSDSDEVWGCIGSVIGIALLVAAAVIAAVTILGVGSVYGAGLAIYNYFCAFRNNVAPQRVPT